MYKRVSRFVQQLRRVLAGLSQTARRRLLRAAPGAGAPGELGMSTAEYAVGTIAACAFAALLYKVVTSTQVFDLLTGLVTRALNTPF